MHEVTFTIEELLFWAGAVGVICAALVWITKGMGPLLRPFREVHELKDRAQSCEIRFASNDRRFDELSMDIKEIMKSQLLLMKHVETGNCTGEVAEGREHLQNYLIDKE